MTRPITLYLAITWLLLGLSQPFAHEIDALFNRKDPVVVVVHYKKVAKVRFWEAVVDVSTTLPKTVLEIHKDENFPDTIQLANIAKKTRGMIYVTTASGVVVHMDVRHWGNPTQLVNVKDGRTEAERAVQRANVQSEMSPEERAVRQLWRAQWGFPTDPVVQVQEINQVLETTAERQVTLTKRYETVGFYGFTQKIRNLTHVTLPLHPSTVRFECPLFSVGLDGYEPHLQPGDNPHEISPGGSVLVHLTCKGARRAKIR